MGRGSIVSTDEREVYDLAEAAWQLSISDKYARQLIKNGQLAAVRQGRKICITREALADYKASLQPYRPNPAA